MIASLHEQNCMSKHFGGPVQTVRIYIMVVNVGGCSELNMPSR